jgi:hypothetical protein
VTADQLTTLLAGRVMGWTAAPNRFLTGNRSWIPRWRFQPTERLSDAARLLEAASPDEYEIKANGTGPVSVRVQIAGRTGEARDRSASRAISLAVADALQITVDPLEGCGRTAGERKVGTL